MKEKAVEGLCHHPRTVPTLPMIRPLALIAKPPPAVTPFEMSIAVIDEAETERETRAVSGATEVSDALQAIEDEMMIAASNPRFEVSIRLIVLPSVGL
jgi:hypothetical protein